MNLGISIPINENVSRMPSYTEIVAQYLDDEAFFEHVSEALKVSQNFLQTFNNVLDIMATLKKHNYSQESLTVMNKLFYNEFHGRLSEESIKETGKRLVELLKNLKERILNLIRLILGKLGEFSSRLKQAIVTFPTRVSKGFKEPYGEFSCIDVTIVDDYSKIIDKFAALPLGSLNDQYDNVNSLLMELRGLQSKDNSVPIKWKGEAEYIRYATSLRSRINQLFSVVNKLKIAIGEYMHGPHRDVVDLEENDTPDEVRDKFKYLQKTSRIDKRCVLVLNIVNNTTHDLDMSVKTLLQSWVKWEKENDPRYSNSDSK